MKPVLLAVFSALGLCLAQNSVQAQEFKEHITKQFTVSGGTVAVYNIWGTIKVEGYSGDKVLMEIDETIKGKTQADVDIAKKEVKLGFDQKADSVIAYTAEPYDTRPHTWNRNDEGHRRDYTVHLDYTIKVPFNASLAVSTVNDGHITVKDVYGSLKVNNVNGSLEIINAKGTTIAHTVNGPVTVNYLAVPPGESSYHTINGQMNITYPANLSADLTFKSMNGQFFTDFPDAQVMPSKVVKTEAKSGAGTTYKLSSNSDVRIGSGGKLFKFETLNGNIYIKKQQ
ncbi:DUF4097 family beta strand repeat-containing protein [Mucilaginibacter ginsenosidivorax]|uniref:DUF4097 domain-containing protein n=1 Tax=Mucilaginibacter ginsenosidivorax TaxID=862126 RepID=A0A5B8VVF4_9SPHI|nr:hypothetical protein [Mucilaginibacter ginsenosidivorax]QEC75389.1 hypothetical protein FSB76_05305 [Mucilaginibacter ginsenosidivorax]